MRLTSAAFFSMLDRRHLLLQHTNRLARQFTWKLAGTSLVQRPAGFPSLYPELTNWRLSVSPRDTPLSGLRRSRSAAQRPAARDAVFRFVPEQTGGAVRPQATLKKKLQKKPAIKRNRERKRNLPPLQHTHPHAHHIAPRTSKTFSAPKRNLSLRPCAQLSAADFLPRLSAVNPPPPTISIPPLPIAPRPLDGRHAPRSSPGPEAVELHACPRRRAAGFQLARPAEPVLLPAAPSNTVP